MSAPPFIQHPFIQISPSVDSQHPHISLISSGTHTPVPTPPFGNFSEGVHPQILPPTNVAFPQISSTVSIPPRWPYFMGAPTRVPPSFGTTSDAHHQTTPSQDFVGLQPQRRSLPNVPPRRHLQDTNISGQNSSRIFPFARGTSQILSFQADTNFRFQPVHSDRSISMSLAFHHCATVQPQAQVAYSAAPYSLLPPSDSILSLPSSSLRVTSSDAHYVHQPLGCHNQHPQPPLVRVPSPPVLYPSHLHSSVGQNLPTSQARFARFESAHHGQLHPSSNRTAACDPQGASFTHSHLPSTFAGALHPMPRSTTSGPFPMFPSPWNGVHNPNMLFHRVAFPENRNIPAPTQADANWSSTLQVHSCNVRYASPHPTMQPLEAKLHGTTGETA